jgi:hypothetical protein
MNKWKDMKIKEGAEFESENPKPETRSGQPETRTQGTATRLGGVFSFDRGNSTGL